jgi:Mycoplasma protein of unknown function, DUF285
MYDMFNAANVFNQVTPSRDTSKVTDVEGIFYGAKSFRLEDFSSWNESSVTNKSIQKCIIIS